MESILQSSVVERGTLDTWPVRSPPHKDQCVIPKPQLLLQLETHLKRELRLLGCPSVGPHELRLQAHKEVFECLIEKFTTYKPLLSAIKNEYDLFITHQNDVIRELLPLQTKLHSVKDEYEKKIVALKEEDKKQDAKEREGYWQLERDIEKLREGEHSYKEQLKRLQEEMASVYEKYRYEADARKLLISDYNELKARQTEDHHEEETVEKEDPTILKLKLARAREDLHAANLRINQVLADYGDVVPRREFEMIESSYRKAESELDAVKAQQSNLMEEYNTLLIMYKDLEGRKDRAAKELAHMKGSATPRPDWSRVGDFIEGGAEKWVEISEGCSSDELVDILLAQLAGVDVSEITQHEMFQGQGCSPDVPRYLQGEGKIPNRKMKQKELEDLISGFWEYRLTKVSEGNAQELLDQALYNYLLGLNKGAESGAIEDGYNLQDSCGRYQHLTNVGVFSSILLGEINEEVYVNWITLQVKLMETLKQESTADNIMSIAQLEEVIRAMFPGKSEPMIRLLVQRAKEVTMATDQVDVIKLMSKGSQNEPNAFVMLLLEQSRDQTRQFVAKLKKLLIEKEEPVTSNEVKDVIKSLDPNTTWTEIDNIVSKIFVDEQTSLSQERLIKSLEATVIC